MQRQGDFNGAISIYRSLLAHDPGNADALHYLGLVMLQTGRLEEAEKLMKQSLQINPHDANTLCDLATVKLKNNKVENALSLYGKVLDLNPNHLDALNNMGKAFIKINKPLDALPLFERLTKIRPNASKAHFDLANTRYKLGDLSTAVESYRKAVDLAPENGKTRVQLGEALESMGKFKQAKMQYLSVLRREPESPYALARLLQLKHSDFDPVVVERAQKVATGNHLKSGIRAQLNFSLAQYYDSHCLYEEAFKFAKKAKDEWYANRPATSTEFSQSTDRLVDIFTWDYFASRSNLGNPSNIPIFIVGMPRSGTTLTEQILASHSQVAPAGELSMMLDLGRQVQELSTTHQAYPEGLRDFGKSELLTLADRYLSRLEKISQSAPRITDKLPFNFIHIGLIAVLFPNAKIVHCHRNPMDTCLSCYFTSFNEQIQFANDLTVMGRYYLEYQRLMKHWQKLLPGRIHNVRYESIVENTETEVQNLLNFCGLEWEDACLSFYETGGGVKTPSRWQVRQPIYSNSVNRWLHYEKQLHSLYEVLSPLLRESEQAHTRPAGFH